MRINVTYGFANTLIPVLPCLLQSEEHYISNLKLSSIDKSD